MAEYRISQSSGNVSLCVAVLLLAFLKTNSAHNTDNGFSNSIVPITDEGSAEEGIKIVKRHLNWNINVFIISMEDSTFNMKIDYLQPHNKNDKVLDNKNYMVFTLYMRNGQALASNTGIFHFIDSETARQYLNNCPRRSMHAAAYYNFYKRCPEDDYNIVASGYCYQRRRGLIYNSDTFNMNMTYVDHQYYENDNRVVHSFEQLIIKFCFNSWNESKFPVSDWRCPLSGIPIASGFTSERENSRFKRSSEECNDCECIGVSGSICYQ